MIDKRSYGARRSRITDDNIRDWVESEAFESRNAASMSILESKLNETSAAKDYPAHGSAEEKRPDGVFRGMSVQLNVMVTSKVMNVPSGHDLEDKVSFTHIHAYIHTYTRTRVCARAHTHTHTHVLRAQGRELAQHFD